MISARERDSDRVRTIERERGGACVRVCVCACACVRMCAKEGEACAMGAKRELKRMMGHEPGETETKKGQN